jgi:hypothetical protein
MHYGFVPKASIQAASNGREGVATVNFEIPLAQVYSAHVTARVSGTNFNNDTIGQVGAFSGSPIASMQIYAQQPQNGNWDLLLGLYWQVIGTGE